MKFFRFAAGIILCACAAVTAFVGADKISEKKDFVRPAEYRGVITLWQIDCFEGGVGSRKKFLLDAARGFEKENQGVLIMAVSHTVESAAKSVENGITPDLISYGCGTEIKNARELRKKTFAAGGVIGEKTYAVPWCRGGYCLITNPKIKVAEDKINSLLVSQGEFTQPLAAFAMEGLVANGFEVMPPMNAYVKFTEGKTPFFLGTQRDVNRLINRGMEFTVRPLTAYNDLYQYISLVSEDAAKSVYAERFIDYLLSDGVQKKLNKIGMFSARLKTEFEGESLNAMQKAEGFQTVSAFLSQEELKEMQSLSFSAAQGNAAALTKIKKLLV